MDPLSLTALVHQKGNNAVEAVVGFIDRMDETERELECTRRDGTAFTSALRTLHLKDDEQGVVRLSLWGPKAAVREPKREQLRVGDLLVVTNVQIDRFMGDKAFKASGFRPALRVIRELATARSVLDRLGLEEPAPYLARVEQLWRWKELEDLRGERMRRQAHQREASLLTAATAEAAAATATTTTLTTTNGFDALCLGQEDAHVCGTALPLTWVERVPKGSGSGSGSGTGAAASAPRVAPRFLRTKVTDGKGVSHILDLPYGIEGLLAFEHASRAAFTAAAHPHPPTTRHHPLPVLLHALGARAVGGLLVPCPTARTRLTLLQPTTATGPAGAGAVSTLEGAAARARVLSVGAARALLLEKQRQRQQQRPSGMDTPPPLLLHLRGRVAGVGVGAERAPLFHSPPPEEGGMDEDDVLQGVLGRLVVRGAGDDGEGECAGGEGQWRYRDVFLRVVDAEAPSSAPAAKAAPRAREEEEAEAAAGEGEGEGEGLWVRVPDAVLRPLLAHVPPGRLVEEAEAAAAAAAEEDTAAETHDSEEKAVASGGAARLCSSPSSSFFYARWVLRAARALASPRNPPFRMTVRVDAAAAAACATAAVAGAVAPRGLGGILASQLSCGGGTGGVEQQQPKLELDLVRLAEAPVEGEEDAMEDGAGGGE